MNIKSILKGAASIAASIIPGGNEILGLVNNFLPEDKQMPTTATGQQILDAVESLPPEQSQFILAKEIDLAIAQEEGWSERYIAMAKTDGQSTRPRIALIMAKLMSFAILLMIVLLFYIAATDGLDSINNTSIWTIFGVLTATPAGVLMKYFGELRREQTNRQSAATGIEPTTALSNIIKLLKK